MLDLELDVGSALRTISRSAALATIAALGVTSCSAGTTVSNSDWMLAGHGYENNRYVESSIDKSNVGQLSPAWRTPIIDDGEQEASPIVLAGTMYSARRKDGRIEVAVPLHPS